MKKVWNFVTTAILIVLLLGIAIMYIPKIFGIQPMIVLSGSMEPTYHVGSLLYIKNADANEKEDGSPVSFDKVLGKPVFNIPQLGYLADKISQTSGKIIYVVAIIVDVILMYMGDLIWSTEQSKNEEKKDESAEK